MKKTKFISSLLSAILILSAVAVPVAAADVNQDSSGGTATVSYTNDSVWTATIPAYVAPVEAGQQDVSAYEVAVKDVVIGDNQQLAATIEYSGYVTEANGVKIPYQLYDSNEEEIQSGDTILSKSAGEPGTEATITFGAALTDSPKYAGVYTDTATFVFTAKDKVYTLDEINADEHLFAIGETQPEYVVAKFNDDYSEVVIFKNGESSDGIMLERFSGKSPMCENAATLQTAIIKEGVKTIGQEAFYRCTALTSVDLPNSLTDIAYMAFSYTAIQNINISNAAIGRYSFSSCANLKQVVFGEQLTSINEYAFSNCTALTEIDIPNGKVTWSAFDGCSAIQTVNIGKSVSMVGNLTGSTLAGYGTSALKYINVDVDNQFWSSEDGVLYDKDKTVLICYPSNKEGSSFTVPDSVTQINNYAFFCCGNLENVSIPASVTYIGNHAFSSSFPTIFGSSGSYAETWATDNGYTFIAQ